MEEYEEVETEEDISDGDIIFLGAGILGICLVFAFVMRVLRKNIKNMHLKIGDKIEVGMETKGE